MKIFDEWFRENSEDAYARNMSRHEIARQAYQAGMLAAADIAKDCYSRDESHSIEWAIRSATRSEDYS